MPDRFYSVGSIIPGFLVRSRIPHGFYLVLFVAYVTIICPLIPFVNSFFVIFSLFVA